MRMSSSTMTNIGLHGDKFSLQGKNGFFTHPQKESVLPLFKFSSHKFRPMLVLLHYVLLI